MDLEFPPLDEIWALGPHQEQDPLHPALLMGSGASFRIQEVGQIGPKKGVVGALLPTGEGVGGQSPPSGASPR